MRSNSLWLALLVLVGVLAWMSLGTVSVTTPSDSRHQEDSPVASTIDAESGRPEKTPAVVAVQDSAGPKTPAVTAQQSPRPGEQRAFRFVLNGDKVDLEAVEDTQGDFHRRRGPMAWQPGMFYCRLLDAAQRVLAEDTLPAPDQTCVVLDPNTPDADGKPRASILSPGGPVVFQVRLPKIESATQMKIYRLAGTRPAAADEEPLGQLLATIPLSK